MESLKQTACNSIENASKELNDLSKDIWNNPELGYKEYHAHKVLTDYLERKGFKVTRKLKIDTAFKAEIGSTEYGPHIAVLCEYDALPGIGHACGHNLIAEAGVAAGVGLQAAFKEAGRPLGKITVLGTPAEEGKGGKILLIKENVFDGVDVAMMTHPTPADEVAPNCIARERIIVRYTGKPSHAAAVPWEGVNALDAAVLCYQGVSCLRQQIKPTWRIHDVVQEMKPDKLESAELSRVERFSGIITKGGDAPNIIPDSTELDFYVRTPKRRELIQAKDKMNACFESAASMTGCQVEYFSPADAYINLITNDTLANVYRSNASILGMEFPPVKEEHCGSTDMGNVSHVVPSIQPHFYCGTDAPNHTREFTTAVASPVQSGPFSVTNLKYSDKNNLGNIKAQAYTLRQGKIMAMTCLDVLTQPDLLQTIKEDFNKSVLQNTDI